MEQVFNRILITRMYCSNAKTTKELKILFPGI